MLTLDKTIAPSLQINLGEKRKTPEKKVILSKNIIFRQAFLLDMKVSFLTTLWKTSPKDFFRPDLQINARGILFSSKVFIYPLNFILPIRMKLWHPCQKNFANCSEIVHTKHEKIFYQTRFLCAERMQVWQISRKFFAKRSKLFQKFPKLNTKMNIAEKTPLQKMFFWLCRKQFC